eukprot:gene11892-3318_t
MPSVDKYVYVQQMKGEPRIPRLPLDAPTWAWVKAKTLAPIPACDAWDKRDGAWVMFDKKQRDAMGFPYGMALLVVRRFLKDLKEDRMGRSQLSGLDGISDERLPRFLEMICPPKMIYPKP